MKNKEFAELLNVGQGTVSLWRQKGWLVLRDDGSIDPDASKDRLMEKRGTLGKLSLQQRRKMSHWSNGPSCNTSRATESHERLMEGKARG
jgi:uncharacterized protein YjcR